MPSQLQTATSIRRSSAAVKLQENRFSGAPKLVIAGRGVGRLDWQAQKTDQHLLLRLARERAKSGEQLLCSVCHFLILAASQQSRPRRHLHKMRLALLQKRVEALLRVGRDGGVGHDAGGKLVSLALRHADLLVERALAHGFGQCATA